MLVHLLRWDGSEDVLHTGQLWGEEEDFIQSSSVLQATPEPANQLHSEREGHHPQANHLHWPHHWHDKTMPNNSNANILQTLYMIKYV